MTIAVLPFNAGPDTPPALARQIANFACDIVRNNTGVEVNAVNYLLRVNENPPRFANVNAAEVLNEYEMISQFFEQAGADKAMDGLLIAKDGTYQLNIRFFEKGNEDPIATHEFSFEESEAFKPIRETIEELAKQAEAKLPEELNDNANIFGTESGAAFLKFLESYDALQYIEKTQGQVAEEFSPTPAMQQLLESAKLDPDWEAPYITLIQLGRACSNFQIGNPQEIESQLKAAIETAPDDGRAYFALGELYSAMGNLTEASNALEKASQLEPEEPAFLTRLGIVQGQMGMPVNAERNFRKAVEMEGPEKPSMDFLAQVLADTNRAHEVPALWKGMIDENPQNAQAHAKYAISLHNTGQAEDAVRAFDLALETVEDNLIIKRYYAPLLANNQEFDRAMDFYEDCLDVAPNEIPLLIEYAQTLQSAGRQFEVPRILKDVLGSNPDPNTRAQTLAWLTELEQPKRIETVESAKNLMEKGDFEGGLRLLKPMRNWLADYWKMWLLIASCFNRTEQWADAEDASTRLINLFPGCEPAYAELAAALGGQERHEDAYNMLRFAMTQVQGSVAVGINLALAAKRTGRGEEAKAIARQIREAVGNEPNLEEVLTEIERD